MVRARHRTPTDRVEERVQLGRIVEAVRRDDRQLRPLDHPSDRLDLPNHLKLLAGHVILDRDQADQMLD